MEGIIKNRIKEELIKAGFKPTSTNIDLVYAEHLNDPLDSKYSRLIYLLEYHLEK